ncbi:hypothetical protein AD953_04170 [Acetobacter malorum]|uniref:Peptidase n=1 Tax=Acetobacter malorum TaxID=178901 RepID=A0A149VDD4_9PROT|nr:PepSY domain-containing protein [Acetobacter malorum]KXV78259.1 hypothetical protein AD953_04170 [Acetobacter malorum]
MKKAFRRALYLTHRWLGIGMALLMAGWCASGIVMLWHTWPQPDARALSAVPAPIHWPATRPDLQDLDSNKRFQASQISMVGQEPVLTLTPDDGPPFALDLRTGRAGRIAPADAAFSALRYARATGAEGPPMFAGLTTDDQWVLDTHGRDNGFYHFVFPDAAHTQVYVSSLTGEVVQVTTRATRLWAWAGAIPHWLYPAVLRKHPLLWKNVVIVLSGTGVFLTVTGLWIGLLRLRRAAPFTPYRGWHCVHHLGGTVFGLFALLWITTGLLTISPAGMFQSNPNAVRPLRVTGAMTGGDIQTALSRLISTAPQDWSGVKTVLLNGHIFMQVRQGSRLQRLDETLTPTPLTRGQIAQSLISKNLLKTQDALTFLSSPDAYYFSRPMHKRHFPVWRAEAADGTRTYLDGQSGEVLAILDLPARQSRWLVYGFHDLDFQAWLRKTTTHWAVALPLLCGVFCIFLSGVIIGIRRLKRLA